VGFVRIPPLRERREEILPLAEAFLAAIRAARGGGFSGLAPAAAELLRDSPWPGNIRQLRHVLERASVLHGDGGALTPAVLGEVLAGEGAPSGPRPAVRQRQALAGRPPAELELPAEGFDLDAWYRAMLAAALRRCDGSPVRTAAYLGITRKVLYTLRKRYDLMEGG
jgi:two-component system repressor protein LuxO